MTADSVLHVLPRMNMMMNQIKMILFGLSLTAGLVYGTQSNAEDDYAHGTANRRPGVKIMNKSAKRAQSAETSVNPAIQAAVESGDLKSYTETLKNTLRSQLGQNPVVAARNLTTAAKFSAALIQLRVLEKCQANGDPVRLLGSAEGKVFLTAFLSDPKWMDDFLLLMDTYSPASKALEKLAYNDALGLLFDILNDPANRGDMKSPFLRNLATAFATTYAGAGHIKNELKNNDPKVFYAFFKNRVKTNQMRSEFSGFSAWELAHITYFKYDIESLEWVTQHLNLPRKEMNDACWRAEYHGRNIFGYSIHGPDYYSPWESADTPFNRMQNIATNGGVCGSLSHLGAMSSIAQGIPATPVGQPGHCAYAIRVNPGQWDGGFGGPHGWAGHNLFGVLSGHTDYLFVSDDIFLNRQHYTTARQQAWCAELCRKDNPKAAFELLKRALTIQPDNLINWDLYMTWLASEKPDRAALTATAKHLAAGFAKRPVIALDLTMRMNDLYEDKKNPASLLSLWEPVMKGTANGWVEWQWKDYMTGQFREFNKDNDRKLAFSNMLCRAFSDAPFFPAVIAWTQSAFENEPAYQKKILAELVKTLSKGGKTDPEAMRKIYAQLILMASASGAADAFQKFSADKSPCYTDHEKNMLAEGQKIAEKMEAFPGECLSKGGVLVPSSTSGWDAPLLHAAVLTPQLGFFHTGGDVRAGATAILSKLTEPTGIIIVAATGNNWRIAPIKVSVSEDGKTWTEVFKSDTYQDIYRIDLQSKRLRIRQVKVERDNDNKEVYHLRGILVYGRKLQ